MDASGAALWRQLTAGWREARRLAELWGPAIDVPSWLTPAIVLGGVLGLVIASGMALAALGVLITALLAAYLLLESVFGVSIQLG
jgi:integral membrane sensor domain MASE1